MGQFRSLSEMSNDEVVQFLNDNIKYIVKLQAWARGNKARRKVAFMKSKQIGSSKYFTFKEYQETEANQTSRSERVKRPQYKFKTGATYEGEWLSGRRDGFGVQIWPDGARYEGEWKDHKASGHGKFIHADGDIYEGMWLNDKANGYGIYIHQNGAKYQGYWKDDLQHGLGVETWQDSSHYEGYYSYGRKQGLGTYKWNDGSTYTG